MSDVASPRKPGSLPGNGLGLTQTCSTRMYESVKARLEAEEAAAAEEQRLVDLVRAEEVAAAARREAANRAARQAQLRASMLAGNQAQLADKVPYGLS